MAPCLEHCPLFNHLSITDPARWWKIKQCWMKVQKQQQTNLIVHSYWLRLRSNLVYPTPISLYSYCIDSLRFKVVWKKNLHLSNTEVTLHCTISTIRPYHQQIQTLSHEHESESLCTEPQPPCISPVWESTMPEGEREVKAHFSVESNGPIYSQCRSSVSAEAFVSFRHSVNLKKHQLNTRTF